MSGAGSQSRVGCLHTERRVCQLNLCWGSCRAVREKGCTPDHLTTEIGLRSMTSHGQGRDGRPEGEVTIWRGRCLDSGLGDGGRNGDAPLERGPILLRALLSPSLIRTGHCQAHGHHCSASPSATHQPPNPNQHGQRAAHPQPAGRPAPFGNEGQVDYSLVPPLTLSRTANHTSTSLKGWTRTEPDHLSALLPLQAHRQSHSWRRRLCSPRSCSGGRSPSRASSGTTPSRPSRSAPRLAPARAGTCSTGSPKRSACRASRTGPSALRRTRSRSGATTSQRSAACWAP